MRSPTLLSSILPSPLLRLAFVADAMNGSSASTPRSGIFLRLLVLVWGSTLLLLSIVATMVRASVGESQPRVKTGLGVFLSVLMTMGGAAHFAPPLVPFYVAMIPPAIPAPALVVAVSGVVELVSGVALGVAIIVGGGAATQAKLTAAWVMVATLVAIFPANLYMALDGRCRARLGVSRTAALARLPLQGTLLVWAHWYTR